MRIIAGSARGLRLRVPRGARVRPTSGRVRTSLFSILGATVQDARVVDLFAGSGALGIEALSRGAAFCCFVETARPALCALEENLARARLAARAEVLAADVFTSLPALEERRPLDLAFVDPPYDLLRRSPGRLLALVEELAERAVLAPGGIVVVQHASTVALPAAVGPLRASDSRRYAATTMTFLER